MTIEVSWDNDEKTLLRFDFSGHWTLQEFSNAAQKSHTMISATPHQGPVATLLILSDKLYMPPNLFSLAQERARHKHPRSIVAVLVTESNFVIMLLKTLQKVYPAHASF